jgi:hypothetical protein
VQGHLQDDVWRRWGHGLRLRSRYNGGGTLSASSIWRIEFFVVLLSSKAGTPVKKNPGGGAEVLTRVLVAFMIKMHTLAHLRELLDASVLSDC